MTSIEWFIEQLEEHLLANDVVLQLKNTEAFEQAKEMHKQEIEQVSEFWHGQRIPKPIHNEYYQETFGSKGSDDHISDISKMVVYTHDDVIKMMDTFHTSILNRDLCMAKLTPIELPKQETLYTEEQVREAIDMARIGIITDVYGDLEVEYLLEKEQIIQSLKQPKKD